ncbi:Protein kinase [Mycena kentingensis (nom. inval.)]|nr:Protein kinase [Mycena kentingensis (nom. inval.)]
MEDGFSLPQWRSQADPLSSSAQAAQAAYYQNGVARSQSMSTGRRRHHNQDELDPFYYDQYSYNNNPPRSPLRAPQDQYQQYPAYGHNRAYSKESPYPSPNPYDRSNPSTPLSYLHSTQAQTPAAYYSPDSQMAVDPPPQKRRASGFRRVRTAHDLQPRLDVPIGGRRMSADGAYLSPLRQLTTNLIETFHICNPQFRYEATHNPRRVLTKPSKPSHNEGYDNEDYDYILYVNDWLGTEDGHKYLILDILGQGTFGQVVKCQNMKTHEIVAVKVVKNKPAYFNQSMMEVTILEMLNKNSDPNDEHHILRLRDSFIHRSHLCLVFELLSSNLYELIKQNQFQGLSTQLVKVFMAQLLDAMTILKDARLIHCDLKPENILLKSLQSPQIKVIDFGSACHERQTVYTYIQSRFYRSPEVLLGMSYTASIDMWSLGCIAVELFLGLPLFPGTSEYNQLTRIVEMLGLPPTSMLNTGKQTAQFFDSYDVYNPHTNQNEKKHGLKSIEQYSREHNTNEQPGKQYFKATSLPEIINTAPMPQSKTARQGHEIEKELNNRASFIDFCQGLLDLNPVTRWTPQQARLHPFITGEKFTKPFVPDSMAASTPSQGPAPVDPKRPYGGLVPSQPKGTRAYTDAASYNHHLGQHQAYTASQAQQSQAAGAFRNPYMTPQSSQAPPPSQQQPQQPPPPTAYPSPPESAYTSPTQPQNAYAPPPAHRTLSHQHSAGQLSGNYHGPPSAGGAASASIGQTNPPSHLVPSSSYYPNHNARTRSNTINQMDPVPPALARLQQMNQDVIQGRNALTPVLNRDDAMREWERRQSGKSAAAVPYPQLEFLQQQAELAGTGGVTNWARYQPPPSKLSHAYHPPSLLGGGSSGGVGGGGGGSDERDEASIRRDVVMSNVRSAAAAGRNDGSPYSNSASNVLPPAQTYSSSSTTSGNRYAATYSQPPPQQQQQQVYSESARPDIPSLFVPMQPDPYANYSSGPPSAGGARHVAPPAQSVPPSFYGAGVAGPPAGRNPFSGVDPSGQQQAKEPRRGSNGMDAWPR